MLCANCGGVAVKRERGVFRDVEFCLSCGYTWEAPGSGVTWAATASTIILRVASVIDDAMRTRQRQA